MNEKKDEIWAICSSCGMQFPEDAMYGELCLDCDDEEYGQSSSTATADA